MSHGGIAMHFMILDNSKKPMGSRNAFTHSSTALGAKIPIATEKKVYLVIKNLSCDQQRCYGQLFVLIYEIRFEYGDE